MVKEPVLAKYRLFEWYMAINIEGGLVYGKQNVESAVVRPLSLGIKPVMEGDTLSFKLDRPAKLVVEINNDVLRVTHIFANPIEVDPPKRGDPGVRYFGPGVHKVGKIPVKSNETVYIAGGAGVYGFIKADGLDNFRITGRGIIDGSIYDR